MTSSGRDGDPAGVTVAGPDDAEPVVFLHGSVVNRTVWAPQRDALAGEYRVITPDLPGHGTRRDEPFRLEAAVDLVDEVVEATTDGRVHLVGLSLGGYVATEFARRRPDAVEDLVLTGSSANPVGLLGTLTRIIGEVTLVAARSDLVERATDWIATRYVRSRDVDRRQAEEMVDAGFDLRSFGEAGLEIAGEDFRSAFASFPGPALVLNGRWDLVMRLGERDHAAAGGEAGVSVVDGAGHVASLDRPREYTARVRRFVDRTVAVRTDD